MSAGRRSNLLDIGIMARCWVKDLLCEENQAEEPEATWTISTKNLNIVDMHSTFSPQPFTSEDHITCTVVLNKTTFTNKSSLKQKFNYCPYVVTQAVYKLTIDKSYGIDNATVSKTNVYVPSQFFHISPKLQDVNSVRREMKLEMVWSTDCDVEVPPNKSIEATLTVLQKLYSARFTVKTRMSGKVGIMDQNDVTRHYEIGIVDLIKYEMAKNRLNVKEFDFTMDDDVVYFTTYGNCGFEYYADKV
ncbi:hypothetical protein HELRODRAFT_191692, partial [Helobdella robusta]|uniref:Uncharacterized protein n=1 Tax=Helobdella robusta TaxID=6412 RepID=T1FT77_HELRO